MMVMATPATSLSINWEQRAVCGDEHDKGHGEDHSHTGIARRDHEQLLQHARQGAEVDRQSELY